MAEAFAAAAGTGVELVACETCGSSDRDTQGHTRGEQLLQHLRSARSETSPVSVASVRCLWACKRSCAVHLRSPGRAGYVLVDLEPSQTCAQALLDYAAMYGESADGAVPFKRWPDPLRGHFLCRTPPVPGSARASAHTPEGVLRPAPLESAAPSDKDSP